MVGNARARRHSDGGDGAEHHKEKREDDRRAHGAHLEKAQNVRHATLLAAAQAE